MGLFDSIKLEDIESMVFGLIKSAGGPDIEQEIKDRKDALLEASEFLEDLSVLLGMSYQALDDNRLSIDELSVLVDAATDIPGALKQISAAWMDDDDDMADEPTGHA